VQEVLLDAKMAQCTKGIVGRILAGDGIEDPPFVERLDNGDDAFTQAQAFKPLFISVPSHRVLSRSQTTHFTFLRSSIASASAGDRSAGGRSAAENPRLRK